MRILVADDHEPVRSCICEILQAEGWQICGSATNGSEAVEMAIRLKPDVLVMDISMPGLNGLDAARQLLKRTTQINVVIMTMHETEPLMEAVLSLGASACVLKTDLQQLVATIRTLAQSSHRHTQRLTRRSAR
jgi:DNA-binding NarL/FixJ family response regulator